MPDKPKRLGRPKQTKADLQLIKALSHPLRAEALATLNMRVASPNEIAEELDADVKEVAYHVRILDKLNCIELVDEGQVRGATEHFYRGTARQYLDDDFWSKLSGPVRNGISLTTLRVLIGTCRDSVSTKLFDRRKDRHASVLTYSLDEKAWVESMTLLNDTLDQLMHIGVKAEERRVKGEAGGQIIRTSFGLLGFESPPTKDGDSSGSESV